MELIRVIDGDTVDVDFDLSRREDPDRIRMIGIDTPETTYSYGNHPECYGEETSKKTDSLLVAASEIWVEVEP
jgi:endonuclease YncB( thermonuclease family)